MIKSKKLSFKFERTIPAPVHEVYKAWLNPEVAGTPWNIAEKYILDPHVDGLYYWQLRGIAHYGRFTKVEPAQCIEHTWVSPNTLGEESRVAVTFRKSGSGTLMTLVHSDLPDTENGRSHERGWGYFLGIFPDQFGTSGKGPAKKARRKA